MEVIISTILLSFCAGFVIGGLVALGLVAITIVILPYSFGPTGY